MIEIIEGEKSPYIFIKPESNCFVMKGNSFMAIPSLFFEKILEWSEHYEVPAGAKLSIEITIGFYNTSTLKIMNMLLKTLVSNNADKVEITLFLEEDDEDQINTASTIAYDVGVEPNIFYY